MVMVLSYYFSKNGLLSVLNNFIIKLMLDKDLVLKA